jgi:hypothetical protein
VAAERVLSLSLPPQVLIEAAVAVSCIGVVLVHVTAQVSSGQLDPMTAALVRDPLLGAAIQLGIMAVIVGMTVRIGRAFGGTGTTWDALRLIVWLDTMLVLLQVVQLVALMVLPPLAAVLAIVTLFWMLWAFANFVTELHGFVNPMLVLGASILAMVVLFFGIAMLLAMLGYSPQGAA